MTNKDQSKTPPPKPSPSDKITRRGSWLRRLFWGVDKEMPCAFGQKQVYVQHWLVGAHSFSSKPC